MTWVADVALASMATLAVLTAARFAIAARRRAKGGRPTRDVLEAHFAPVPLEELIVVRRTFPARMRADLQRAVEAVVSTGRVVKAVHGVQSMHGPDTGFAALVGAGEWSPRVAPPSFVEVDIGATEPVRCAETALWLLVERASPLVLYVRPDATHFQTKDVVVEVAVPAGVAGAGIPEAIFRALEEGIARAASYRGKVLSLERSTHWGGHAEGIRVHRLAPVRREDIVLPRRVLDLLERNILRFVEQRDRLAALGQRLYKGVLFYGAPGTGKTYTIQWLSGALPDHTVLLVTAEQIGLLAEYMSLARMLEPSIVVVEDADLVARERTAREGACVEAALNGLLNELDGLREDARIIVVLTTNRPETIEPALAGRPGRIDQAIEFPLPDDDCRRRLVALYSRGMRLEDGLAAEVVRRTDRGSPAFVKELLRKTAQVALERAPEPALTAADLDTALDELLFTGGRLNAKLLGFEESDDGRAARSARA